MADDTKALANRASEALAIVRAEIAKAGFKGFLGGLFNRYPQGSSKGGQFAPKGQSGGGGEGFHDEHAGGGGKPIGKPKPNPGSVPHPQKDNHGEPVHVNYPSKASGADTWHAGDKTASFIPGQKDMPDAINGVAFTNAKEPADWSRVRGTNAKIDADMPFTPTEGKSTGAGVVILEPDGRMWLTKPTNEFGGYKHTFPKGTAEQGLSLQQNAIKEAFEETGLQVKITGVLGDFERTTSKARFYIAERIGGSPKNMGWESQAIRLAPMRDAFKLLNRKDVDHPILHELEHLMSFRKVLFFKSWDKQARWPAGTPLGGQWRAIGADGITLPPKIAGGHEGKNAIYQKAADSAHSMAQGGDLVGAHMAMAKYVGAANKFDAKQITSSHVKWGAQAYQYAKQLTDDVKAKGAATVVADRIAGPQKLSSMGPMIAPKPGGSNPGGIYAGPGGEKVLVKGNKQLEVGNQSLATSEMRAKNEVLAAKLLQAAGVGAPEMKLVNLEGKYGGGLGVASTMVQGVGKLDPGNPQHVAAAQKDFAVNAWLGNYDALGMGYDNTVIKNGKAICIDPGGALMFRAQGALKDPQSPTASLDPTAPEVETMRKTSPEQMSIYGKMTAPQLAASAQALHNVSNDTIKNLVSAYGPGDDKMKADITNRLIARRDAVLAKLDTQPAATLPPAPPPAPVAPPVAAPKPGKGLSPLLQGTPGEAPTSNGKKALELMDQSYRAVQKSGAAQKIADATPTHSLGAGNPVAKVVEEHFANKDAYSLAKYAVELKQGQAAMEAAGSSVGASEAKAHVTFATQKLVQLQAKIIVEAKPITPVTPPSSLVKPTFASGFDKADAFYNQMADNFAAMHTASDLAALKQAGSTGNYDVVGGGKVPWKPGSKSGIAMAAYHQSLVNDLEGKQAAVTVVTAKHANEAITKPIPTGSAAPQAAGALPNFDVKIPSHNTNASTHNAKIDTMSNLAQSGDVKGLLSLSYSTNTYGKKEAKLANAALAALGSPHTVAPGQKKASHPSLTGGVTSQYLNVAAAKVGQPIAQPHKVVDFTKLDMSKASSLNVQKFTASSKPHLNEQNNKLAAEIEAVYKSGNLTALQSMTFKVLAYDTNTETGEVLHISEHKSKPLVGIYDTAVANMKDIASPPAPLKHFDAAVAKSVADIDRHFPSKPMGTVVSKQPKNEQLGYWLALGKIGDHEKLVPKKQMDVSEPVKKAAFAKHGSLPPATKNFISHMQSSGSFATAYRQGNESYSGHNLKDMAISAEKDATAHVPGTKIYRWSSMPSEMVKTLIHADPGTVFQATGPMPASWHPTCNGPAGKNFGSNRMEIVFAPGAKAVDSFGSGEFSTEREITTLPNARFVLLSSKPLGHGSVDIKVLMLPPDLGLGTKPKRKKKDQTPGG